MSTDNVINPAAANGPAAKPRTPDELNKLLKITHPYHWLSISALVALTLFTIVWSIFGTIPTRVQGIGQITTSKGLHPVVIVYQGELTQMYCHLGDTVKEGQLLATMSQPELDQQLAQYLTQRSVLQQQLGFLKSNNQTNLSIKNQSNGAQKDRLQKQIVNDNAKIKYLEQREQEQQQLYKDGLITYDQFFKTKDDLALARTTRNRDNEDLINIELGTHEWNLNNSVKEQDLVGQLSVIDKKISEAGKQDTLQTSIKATATGIISAISANTNEVVKPGQTLFTIEENHNEDARKLDLFIPFNSNSVIKPGMEVQVEPFTMDHNLYGWLLGDVVSVNQYVSSQASLNTQLNNPDLVALITKGGPVYQVTVALRRDTTTFCKYACSNKVGPPFALQMGTLCNAFVEVKQKAPIDYVIPIFKEYFQ
jgi:HlyD family secretion protein